MTARNLKTTPGLPGFAERLKGSTPAELEADAAALAVLGPPDRVPDDKPSSLEELTMDAFREFRASRDKHDQDVRRRFPLPDER